MGAAGVAFQARQMMQFIRAYASGSMRYFIKTIVREA